jgi:hypothetical protein
MNASETIAAGMLFWIYRDHPSVLNVDGMYASSIVMCGVLHVLKVDPIAHVIMALLCKWEKIYLLFRHLLIESTCCRD